MPFNYCNLFLFIFYVGNLFICKFNFMKKMFEKIVGKLVTVAIYSYGYDLLTN